MLLRRNAQTAGCVVFDELNFATKQLRPSFLSISLHTSHFRRQIDACHKTS